MSTLSELIPSGGTQNNIEFVAQGTLANGQAVALRSDGKVEAISETSASNGTAVQFSTGSYAEEILSFPIPSTNQIVVAYQEAGIDNSFKAVVGTITANAIVFSSSPIAVSGGVAVTWIAGCFETGESKVVFAWTNNSNKLVALGGSVSGTGSSATISLGSASTISTSQITTGTVFLQDNPSASGKTQFIYRDQSNATAKVLTLSINSSNTIGTGGATTITSTSYPRGVGLTTEDDKSILIDSPNGGNLVLYVGSYNSGADTWSFNTGSPVALNSGDNSLYNNPVVVANNFIAIVFQNASGYPTVNSFTLSGTTLTAGTPLTLVSGGAGRNGFAYDATASKYVFGYRNSSGVGMYHTINFSGTAFTAVSSAIQFVAATVDVSVAYNASQGKTIFSFSDGGDSEKGKGQVYTLAISNASSFIGITNAAISSSATGEVAVKGGLSATASFPTTIALGAEASLYSGTNYDRRINYDPSNNKFLAVLRTGSGGAVQVGTLSGTTMAWGTAVTFSGLSNSESDQQVSYNSNTQSFLITFPDSDNSQYPTAMVAKISGTSVTLGTRAVISSTGTPKMYLTYDSTAQKNVIGFAKNGTNYNFGIVATIDGSNNTVSFGSEQVFDTSGQNYVTGVTYDPTSNKTLFTRINNVGGVGTVGTVSGTSISFGSDTAFGTSENPYRIETVYDASAQKLISTYVGDIGSQQVKSRVATISGTSVAFGTQVTFGDTGIGSTDFSATYAPSINAILCTTSSTSTYGQITVLTSDGTNVSVGSITQYSGVDTDYLASAFDTANSKVVVLYDVNSSNAAKYIAGDVSAAGVIGSTYYVQDGGTLATTSSSNKAGKAISTTALNLVDPT